MIQTTKHRHPSLAVLAAGALVASLLAAGTAPAGAVTDRADHTTPVSACVGDATADQMFTDVSAGHVFRGAINCIAYYGITHGTGDGSTYSPDQEVTRAQMAVFIARAAETAGVDLGAAAGAGFDDIDGIWQEARDAINRLASKGMIPTGAAFRPGDAVTRAEMATFLIGLLVEAAPDVSRDSQGTLLLGVGGSPSVSDDYFADANNAETSALYELGITKGASAASVQEPGKPPLDFNYEPGGTVDRGQMAAFITRALAHTPVRPAGVSAQYDGADVIVSVRNARFLPVSRAAVDVFWTTADQAGQAFSADGACRLAEVTQADHSSFPCEIDGTDPVTGRGGDATVAVTGLRRVPEGGAVVWAWTGRDGDAVGPATELHRLDVAEGADIGYATSTLVTTSFNARKVRFGATVLYTMQLRDRVGSVSTGANGIDPARWSLSIQATGQAAETQTLVSDSSGEVVFSVSVDDPNPGTDDADLTVTYRLTGIDNAPPGGATVRADGQGAATGTLTFSDDAPSIASGSATVSIDTRSYVHVRGGSASNAVTVTVLDQYGSAFPGAQVSLTSTLTGVSTGGDGTVDGNGARRFAYRYSGQAATETLTPSYGATTADTTGPTATVYWAVDAGPSESNAKQVVAGDVRRREIVVEESAGTPVLLAYDSNDRFNLRGSPTTLTVFEAELAAALKRSNPGLSLTWSNYVPGSRRPGTELSLT